MLFPQFYSFLLLCSFQFCFGCAPPSTHFVYCLLRFPRLPIFHWVSNLIWFCMYPVCSFRYMLANSFCAFFSFRALVFVEFFLLNLEAVFMSACFSLTTNISHRTLFIPHCDVKASKCFLHIEPLYSPLWRKSK